MLFVCFFPSSVLIRVEQSGLSSFNRLHMQKYFKRNPSTSAQFENMPLHCEAQALNLRRREQARMGGEEREKNETEITLCLFATMDRFRMKSLEQSEHTIHTYPLPELLG